MGPKKAAMAEEEATIANLCWQSFGSESLFALYSPLCVSLAAGTLDSRSFSTFLANGSDILKSFVQAYELAEDCADDDEEKKAIRQLRECVVQKLENRKKLVHSWGFQIPETSSSDAPPLQYISFLLATASGKVEGEQGPCNIDTPFERTKVAAYTLGVIAACTRLYASLSYGIKAYLDPSEIARISKEWIRYYTSQDFKAEIRNTEDVMEKLSASLTDAELVLQEKLYKQALTLQLEFFATQQISPKSLVPLSQAQEFGNRKLTIFCDFDLTCASVDSGATLAELAIVTNQAHFNFTTYEHVQQVSGNLMGRWNAISDKYSQGFGLCIETITSGVPGEEFDYKGLSTALEKVSMFEKSANAMMVESGLLRGISQESINHAGNSLVLQDGCRRFFQKIVEKEIPNIDVHIISYCWCSDLIRAAFSSNINASNIHSNELVYEESRTTGGMVRKIESPEEKLRAFFEVVRSCSTEAEHLTVYIGGDAGDLLCLLEADIGIVTGSSRSLRRLGRHFGVKFVPLFHGLVQKQKEAAADSAKGWKPRSGILYTVSCWAEIEAFVLGY